MADVNSGLEGVLAAETTISLVDGSAGRLLYRGYEIGDLAAHGSFDSVTALLLDGEWPAAPEALPPAELDEPVLAALPPTLPRSTRCAQASRPGAPPAGWTGRQRPPRPES
jgi:citrate synthase